MTAEERRMLALVAMREAERLPRGALRGHLWGSAFGRLMMAEIEIEAARMREQIRAHVEPPSRS